MAAQFNLAIAVLTMWLVAHLGIIMAGYRLMVIESDYWTESRLDRARVVIRRTSAFSIAFATLVFVATALGVSLSTQNMDSRAYAIVIGTGLLISAITLTMLSFSMARWLGVYHHYPIVFPKSNAVSSQVSSSLVTIKQLRFHLGWVIFQTFAEVYIVTALQFCAIVPGTVPLSVLVGVISGLLLHSGIYVGRTKWKEYKTRFAMVMTFGVSVAASVSFAFGMWYIQEVWKQDTGLSRGGVLSSMFFSWLVICAVLNIIAWSHTKKFIADAAHSNDDDDDDDDLKYDDQYPTEIFNRKHHKQSNGNSEEGVPPFNSASSGTQQEEEPPQENTSARDKITSTSTAVEHVEVVASIEDAGVDVEQLEIQIKEDPNGGNGDNDPIAEKTVEGIGSSTANETANATGGIGGGDVEKTEEEEEKALTYEELQRLIEENEETDTNLHMFHMKICCGANCCGCCQKLKNTEPRTCSERVLSGCKWFFAIVINAFCLYFTVVNIGATNEMELVRYHLPSATRSLYPPDYLNGTMCAWDEPTPNGTIKTFETLQDVYDANWTVIHCQPCANCSNWNDMEIQWITRDSLAAQAQSCALKSLFGTAQDVQQCYLDEVGFYDACAACWTFDSLCSKYYCTFIFLQSVIINNAGNFSVGPEHVTSATCEEAMCGEEYAPCAGATRRRMNIESDIERPEWQQCSVAEHDWAKVFNHP